MLTLQHLTSDVRYALRQFRLTPVFTLTAMLTLALGIGGTTAIFSLVHAIMLRSLPVVDPASLYRIGEGQHCCVEGGLQENWNLFSFALYERFKAATPEFEQLTAFEARSAKFSVRRGTADPIAKSIRGEFVTGNYFSTFGIGSFAGRTLRAADDQAAATPVAVLSYRIWQQNYGSDPSLIGSKFIVDGHPFVIVGISPPGFFGETLRSEPPDLWLPMQQEPLIEGESSLLRHPSTHWLRVIGRLRPGASIAGMPVRLTMLLRRWLPAESGYPAEFIPEVEHALSKQTVKIIPAGGGVEAMRAEYEDSLRILLTVCSLVLLIACANVANLLLARGIARRSHASLRLALGASRFQLIRQLMTESLLLGLLGGAAGIALAYAGARLILILAFGTSSLIPIDVSLSWPVLAFAIGLSLLTGVLFGTAPAWFASRTNPVEALRGANRSTSDNSSFSQKALIVFQAALSVVLLAGAGMLTRSLRNLETQDLGFATRNRVSVLLNSPIATYTPERLETLYRRLEERLARVPGVERASLALYTPFVDHWSDGIYVEGQTAPNLNLEDQGAAWDRVSPGYFETLGQPILRGRGIGRQDTATTRAVAVINRAFVVKYFPRKDPVGKHFGIEMPENARVYEIVGIVPDAKYSEPEKPAEPMFFVPLSQYIAYKEPLLQQGEFRSHFIRSALLVTNRDLGGLEPQIRKAVSEVDPDLSIEKIQSLEQQVNVSFDQQRAVAQLTSGFGFIALLLAAVGLYGVTAYTVARRTSEIGVRMALGADRTNVTRLVLWGAFVQVAIGLLIGIPAAIGAGRFISSQLYRVESWDPLALAIAIVALVICALIATIVPARRAASIDPMRALRTE